MNCNAECLDSLKEVWCHLKVGNCVFVELCNKIYVSTDITIQPSTIHTSTPSYHSITVSQVTTIHPQLGRTSEKCVVGDGQYVEENVSDRQAREEEIE